MEIDHDIESRELLETIESKLLQIRLPGADYTVVTAVESLSGINSALGFKDIPTCSINDINDIESQKTVKIERKIDRLITLIAEWLRFYCPVQETFLQKVFGLDEDLLDRVLESLVESRTVIVDQLTKGQSRLEFCDAENLERLLRLMRKEAKPEFKALPTDHLPLFLATYQGITGKRGSKDSAGNKNFPDNKDSLQSILEKLFGFPAAAGTWESDIFPARLSPYYTSWLDKLIQQSELQWFGCGNEQSSFCFISEYELFSASSDIEEDTPEILPDRMGKFSFWDILEHTKTNTSEANRMLWENVWKGILTADSFDVVRKGISNRFDAGQLREKSRPRQGRRGRRALGNKWKAFHQFSGNWYSLNKEANGDDLLYNEEIIKDRVRQILERYGIIFKELLGQEMPMFKWSALFRTLRIMELSGEILSGHFFDGIPGLQFMSHQAFMLLNRGLPEKSVYWMNAVDPASPCGVRILFNALKSGSETMINTLPSRIPSNHLVFHGAKLVLISKRKGSELEIAVKPGDPVLKEYLEVFKVQLTRDFNPWKTVRVEMINGEPAGGGLYERDFISYGFIKDYKTLILKY